MLTQTRPRSNGPYDVQRRFDLMSPDRGGEGVVNPVGSINRLVETAAARYGECRSEYFLAPDSHRWRTQSGAPNICSPFGRSRRVVSRAPSLRALSDRRARCCATGLRNSAAHLALGSPTRRSATISVNASSTSSSMSSWTSSAGQKPSSQRSIQPLQAIARAPTHGK